MCYTECAENAVKRGVLTALKILKPRKKLSVTFDSKITISGLSLEERNEVKEELTYENPLYVTTQKYSRYAYTNVPPYLTYYKGVRSDLIVPAGYNMSRFSCSTTDNRVYEKVVVPDFALSLRDSQAEAAQSFISANMTPFIKGCIQMPTGKGKSILGLYLAHHYSCKTLIVVHKDDLITGWQEDIKLSFNRKVVPGLIKAQSRRIGNFITLATVQTLNRLSPTELDKLYNTFGLVIQDEMHHCPASSFEIVSNFNSRYRMGLTATPERSDGLAHVMNLYFGDFCYRYVATDKEEDILPVQVRVRNTQVYFNPSCDRVRLPNNRLTYSVKDLYYPRNGVLADNQVRLSEIPYSSRPKVPFQVIDDFIVRSAMEQVVTDIVTEYGRGHSCVVFFTQKEHCRLYYEALNELIPESRLGIYYGDNTDNDAVREQAENNRQFVTLTTYAKATEGTNVKRWEVEFLVSSINNEKNTEQAAGRIRRTLEGKISPAVLYDYRYPDVYSVSSHGRTRDVRYKALGFTFEGNPTKKTTMFSRGYMSR